jgi:hypothetical protein
MSAAATMSGARWVEQSDGAIGEVLAVDRSQIGLIGEGFFELCLLDGSLIVDGRLEVAQGGVGLAEGGADGHAVARERSADGGDGVEGVVGAAAAFGFVALAHQEVLAVFEVVDFVEAASSASYRLRGVYGGLGVVCERARRSGVVGQRLGAESKPRGEHANLGLDVRPLGGQPFDGCGRRRLP